MGKLRVQVRAIGLAAPLLLALLGAAPPEWTAPEGAPEGATEEVQPPAPPPAAVTHATANRMAPYEPLRAGHPLRIIAYALHPIGVILDYAIFRPAYWLGSHEPIRTLVGQTE
jgi:hypothetical protein